jgi:immunoglobulin-binding protein 1
MLYFQQRPPAFLRFVRRPASLERPTTSEQLALDAEQDGSAFGARREEERRQKDEKWAMFTDANPRGAGNTMNRG